MTLRRLQSATAGDSAPPHPQTRCACWLAAIGRPVALHACGASLCSPLIAKFLPPAYRAHICEDMRQASCMHAGPFFELAVCCCTAPQRLQRLTCTGERAWQNLVDLAGGESGSAEAWLPSWFPAAYDLVTEVQFFLKDFRQARTSILLVNLLVRAFPCWRCCAGHNSVPSTYRVGHT